MSPPVGHTARLNKLGRWKLGPAGLNSMKMHEVHEEDFRLNAGRHF